MNEWLVDYDENTKTTDFIVQSSSCVYFNIISWDKVDIKVLIKVDYRQARQEKNLRGNSILKSFNTIW